MENVLHVLSLVKIALIMMALNALLVLWDIICSRMFLTPVKTHALMDIGKTIKLEYVPPVILYAKLVWMAPQQIAKPVKMVLT